MALATALVTQGEHDARLAAGLGDGAPLGNGVGDRLVEKNMLAGRRRGARRLKVRVVRRGVDDRLDCAIVEDSLVARRRFAPVLRGERFALVFRARVACDDLEFFRPLDGVGEDVRPPAHPDAGDPQRFERHRHFELAPIDSTASRAMRSSVAQSAPLTPTPPMHSLSTMIGQPPSIAVQRSGPAASARLSAWAVPSAWPCATWDEVVRLFEAAQTALVVAECRE